MKSIMYATLLALCICTEASVQVFDDSSQDISFINQVQNTNAEADIAIGLTEESDVDADDPTEHAK